MTADIGEGHDLPARMIKEDVEREIPGATVEIVDGLKAMGRISSSVARDGSRFTFRWMPWLFDLQYWLITKFAPTRWLMHHLSYLVGARGLMASRAARSDVVVSTYRA
jgi:hypothetical protein